MATASKALNPEIRAWLEAEGVDPSEAEISELTVTTEAARPTEIELRLVTDEPFAVNPGKLLGQNARLHLEWEGGRARRRFARVYAVDRMMDVRNHAYVYRVRLASRLHGLDFRARLSVHADVSVPEAIRATLARAGLVEGVDYKMRLRAIYPPREFIIQYQETDLAFVTRLCEHWGLSFFFEEGEDRDVAVFADANVFWPRAEGGICFGVSGHRQEIFDFHAETSLLPERFVLRDYNYRYPRVGLQSVIEFKGGVDGEIVEYGANFRDEKEAELLTVVRRDELIGRREVYRGVAAQPLLEAGMVFTLTNHQLHEDEELAVHRCEERLTQPTFMSGPQERATFTATFEATRADIDFRPQRRIPRPRVDGVLHGIIEPREGQEYGQVDDQGCYRVRLLIDDPLDKGGHPYPVVRLAQPSGGAGYGFHFPLRPGTEVMLAFIEGDPDRPIITGTAPNPSDRTPVALQNHARNVIRTESGNQIDLDDTKEGTRMKLSVPFKATSLQLGSPNGPEEGIYAESAGSLQSIATTTSGFTSPLQTYWSTYISKHSHHVISEAKLPEVWSTLEKAEAVFELGSEMALQLWEVAETLGEKYASFTEKAHEIAERDLQKMKRELEEYETSKQEQAFEEVAKALKELGFTDALEELRDEADDDVRGIDRYLKLKATGDADLTDGQKQCRARLEGEEQPFKAYLAFLLALGMARFFEGTYEEACEKRNGAVEKRDEHAEKKAAEELKEAKLDDRLKALATAREALDKALRAAMKGKAYEKRIEEISARLKALEQGHRAYAAKLQEICAGKHGLATFKRDVLDKDSHKSAAFYGARISDGIKLVQAAKKAYEDVKKAKHLWSQVKTLRAGATLTEDLVLENLAHLTAWATVHSEDLAGQNAVKGRAFDASHQSRAATGDALNPTGLFAITNALNLMRSKTAAVVSSEERVFVHGPLVTLAGMTAPDPDNPAAGGSGTAVVYGKDVAIVSSEQLSEVHSREEVLLSGKKIDVQGAESIDIVLVDDRIGGHDVEHKIRISEDAITVTLGGNGKKVVVNAPQGDVEVTAKNLTATADAVKVTGSETADIVTKAATVDASDSATVKTKAFKVESDSFEVDAKSIKMTGMDKVAIGTSGAGLQLDAASATLKAPSIEATS